MQKKRILYVDSMVDAECAEVFFEGILAALARSPIRDQVELEVLKFNHGDNPGSPLALCGLVTHLRIDGVILSGSEKNTTDRHDVWVAQYLQGLREMLNAFPTLPVYGICFGHQALACAFGGTTSRFDFKSGFEAISMLPGHDAHRLFSKLAAKLLVGVSHADHVTEVPKDFRIAWTSDYCQCQAMVHQARPIIGTQFHPELTLDILQVKTKRPNWIASSEAEFSRQDGPQFLTAALEWMYEHM